MLLRSLVSSSMPSTRVHSHLLHLDAHDVYEFVRSNPDALTVGRIGGRKSKATVQ